MIRSGGASGAGVAAVALVAVAAPVAAEPLVNIDYDSPGAYMLTDALDADSVPYSSRADAMYLALNLCATLAQGGTYADAVAQAVDDGNPVWTGVEAALFTRAAHSVFCPGF